MILLDRYREDFNVHKTNYISSYETPENLYVPIQYIMSLGGKQLRPLLTLMACESYGKPYNKGLDAALAVELFHNFSLMHDDIMDNAPLRRGQRTIHEKWDTNTAILSGDALLIMAYRLFENYPSEIFKQLAVLFSTTAIKVCEGQQLDMDFQQKSTVTISAYTEMINNKTAVLLGAALEMGAIIAEASTHDREHLYEFGRNLGIAFQIQDDYLDAFGDLSTFGKQTGGDIIENKKTYLYLKAIEKAGDEDRKILQSLFEVRPENLEEKIETVKKIYMATGAVEDTQEAVQHYMSTSLNHIDVLQITPDKKQWFLDFANFITQRNH